MGVVGILLNARENTDPQFNESPGSAVRAEGYHRPARANNTETAAFCESLLIPVFRASDFLYCMAGQLNSRATRLSGRIYLAIVGQ
jgi:hypothetical protein